jgi:CheY-like chemotaxis protein
VQLKLGVRKWAIPVKLIVDKMPKSFRSASPPGLDLARVLVIHGELAPRLALQTILRAGGYAVDGAATPAEAMAKLDEGRYELVLSDAEFDSRAAGRKVLAYARVKEYRPATALITSSHLEQPRASRRRSQLAIHTENLPNLLDKVAELIGLRASRRYRPLGHAAV